MLEVYFKWWLLLITMEKWYLLTICLLCSIYFLSWNIQMSEMKNEPIIIENDVLVEGKTEWKTLWHFSYLSFLINLAIKNFLLSITYYLHFMTDNSKTFLHWLFAFNKVLKQAPCVFLAKTVFRIQNRRVVVKRNLSFITTLTNIGNKKWSILNCRY